MPITHRLHASSSLSSVSYEQYAAALHSMEGVQQTALWMPEPLKQWVESTKELFQQIAEQTRLGITELLALFRRREIFALLKAIKFDLVKIVKGIRAVSGLISSGIIAVFEELSKTNAIQRLREGSLKLDAILDKHPVLKRITGFALFGLLLYIWWMIPFIGDVDFDFDVSELVGALTGSFKITDLFLSPTGLACLALFAVGSFTGISFIWLGSDLLNILVVVLYNAAFHLNKTSVASKLRRLIKFKRY